MAQISLEEAFVALASNQKIPVAELADSTLAELTHYGVNARKGVLDPTRYEYLDQATIASQLRDSTINWLTKLDVLASTASTNSDLLALAENSSIEGIAITAEVQTGGRGRRGRQWVSPFAQNVALSIGMSIDRPTAEVGPISLSVGLAVANAIKQLGIPVIELKWPNDVLIDGQKAAGILIELADATRPAKLIIGIGVNVFSAPGKEITGEYLATCLASHTAKPSRNRVVAELINHVFEAVKQHERVGFDGTLQHWQELDYLRGKDVVLLSGDQAIEGHGLGIDGEGSYLIQTPNGIERAIGGDLSLRLA